MTENSAIPESIITLQGRLYTWIFDQVSIAPLVVFRIVFGLMMFAGTLRFALNGWIESLYITPKFHFTYYGFDWVQVPGAMGMYLLFFIMGISALGLALGYKYQWSAVLFFLSFTYIELIDKSTYLNHYYFVSIVAALLIFLPAGRYFSIDVWQKPEHTITHIPRYFIGIIQLQLGIVYFFAGLAKLNHDWLLDAMPLRIWLQPHSEMPIIGYFMDKTWVAYVFSWFGALYDLSIPFLLLNKKTRVIAYIFVIAFHVLTYVLFQIGLFPFIMILCTLIFFSEQFHKKVLYTIANIFKFPKTLSQPSLQHWTTNTLKNRVFLGALLLHFTVQFLFPFRYLLYPGQLFWTEEGFRFSWRVMLMEKAGKAFFYVTDQNTKAKAEIIPSEYLTANQEKMMATQPDMILQFAHFIKREYEQKGIKNIKVTVDSYVSLNGGGSRRFIDSSIDLGREHDSWRHKRWILPYSQQ